ncbi:hypothetical protein BROUX41_005124 [Berkeleyomyces rouxiae]
MLLASAALSSPTPASSPGLRARTLDYKTCIGDETSSDCGDNFTCTPNPLAESEDAPKICLPSLSSGNMCSGFAGFACPEADQVCLDYPYDDCDPKLGGADCIGWCI